MASKVRPPPPEPRLPRRRMALAKAAATDHERAWTRKRATAPHKLRVLVPPSPPGRARRERRSEVVKGGAKHLDAVHVRLGPAPPPADEGALGPRNAPREGDCARATAASGRGTKRAREGLTEALRSRRSCPFGDRVTQIDGGCRPPD
eukprot:scaffold5034_cov385-Prasinococcus_capsulatus_cf.AAC.9